jgi:soluble lytic murein transglycosylase-like protein
MSLMAIILSVNSGLRDLVASIIAIEVKYQSAAGLPAGAVRLDHGLPITGRHDAKWGLRLNVSAEEILRAVSN